MAKNRVIYQSEALFVGPSPATGQQFSRVTNTGYFAINQLSRVQSVNYGYTLNRQDVNQFGELAAIDRVMLEPPTVNLDFSYLSNSFRNEELLGFYVTKTAGVVSAISGMLSKTEDEKNYWIKTVAEGQDATNYTNNSTTTASFIGVGNGFISNYTAEGSVGDFPRASVTVEALNVSFETAAATHIPAVIANWSGAAGTLPASGAVVFSPAVNPTDGTKITGYCPIPNAVSNSYGVTTGFYATSVLRPGDITFEFKDGGATSNAVVTGVDVSDIKIQNYSLGVGLSRDPIQKLGTKYAFSREIRFPVTVNFRVDAMVGDITTGNLADVIQNDKSYDCAINIQHPTLGLRAMRYEIRGAKLDSQSYSASIGPNKTVSLNFSAQIGSVQQTGVGLFFSGYNAPTV